VAEPQTASRRTQASKQRTASRPPSVYTRLITTSLSNLGAVNSGRKVVYGAIAAGVLALVAGGGALLASGMRAPFAECGGLFSRADCWGAVVNKDGNIFARVEEPAKEAAEQAALKKCGDKFGGTGCKVIATISKHECWALAEMPTDPSRWKSASGPSIAQAETGARWDCERAYGLCQISLTFCADGTKSH
jgi:hypothetical protein